MDWFLNSGSSFQFSVVPSEVGPIAVFFKKQLKDTSAWKKVIMAARSHVLSSNVAHSQCLVNPQQTLLHK